MLVSFLVILRREQRNEARPCGRACLVCRPSHHQTLDSENGREHNHGNQGLMLRPWYGMVADLEYGATVVCNNKYIYGEYDRAW